MPHSGNAFLIFNHCPLQVLCKPGQLVFQTQTAPDVAMQPEQSNQEVSSGAGELSDSVSVAEVGVPVIKKKKSRVKKSSAATPLASQHRIFSNKGMIILLL